MHNNILDVIIVGAGPAGLSASYYLRQYGLEHIVFERGRIGASWRSQRWHSFMMNTANKLNALPGSHYQGDAPDGYSTAGAFVASLEAYCRAFQLPVKEEAAVLSVEKRASLFEVTVAEQAATRSYRCRQVIIASGEMSALTLPNLANRLDAGIRQLHAGQYRHPSLLPEGAVLVVGSAQSGCQIAEDLLDSGRKVYLATSRVPRVPRHYRGKDIMDWLLLMRFFEARPEDITDPAMLQLRAPQLTGVGAKRSISLQALARKGAVILGRLKDVAAGAAFFEDNAAAHIKFADDFSQKVREMIDGFIATNGLNASAPEPDEADAPDLHAQAAASLPSLDLAAHQVRSVIWATGFLPDFSYLQAPVLDKAGKPVHRNGVSEVAGLYFLGLHWLRNRKSGTIPGIGEDAAFISQKVLAFHQQHLEQPAR